MAKNPKPYYVGEVKKDMRVLAITSNHLPMQEGIVTAVKETYTNPHNGRQIQTIFVEFPNRIGNGWFEIWNDCSGELFRLTPNKE